MNKVTAPSQKFELLPTRHPKRFRIDPGIFFLRQERIQSKPIHIKNWPSRNPERPRCGGMLKQAIYVRQNPYKYFFWDVEDLEDGNFVIKNENGTIPFLSTVKDTGVLSYDRNGQGNEDIFAMPSGAGPLTNIQANQWKASDYFECKNTAFLYLDENFNYKVDISDKVRIYQDNDNDGLPEVFPGYIFEIWDKANSGFVLFSTYLPP